MTGPEQARTASTGARRSALWWRAVKLALFAVILGGLVLFGSIVREKWFTHKRDPYKGVQR